MRYDVCVFGGCSLDQMYYISDDGSYNEKPDLLVFGGKGANQAVAASRAGAVVSIISRLGKDNIGQRILDNLHYNGVLTNNVEMVDNLDNDFSNVYIDNNKDNHIERYVGAVNSFTKDMIKRYERVLTTSKIVLAQLKVPKEVTVELINFCYVNNIPLIITPCRPEKLRLKDDNNKDLIDKISYITANRSECETIFGTTNIEDCVRKYPNKLIVTLGSDGVIYHNGDNVCHIKAIDIDNLTDTTGAGDTFAGNLAFCLANGYNLEDAVERAQYASAMKIQSVSAQSGMPYKDELDSFIRKNQNKCVKKKTM